MPRPGRPRDSLPDDETRARYDECIAQVAQTSAEIQERRWADLLDHGTDVVARAVWQPWMTMSEGELAARYREVLKGSGSAIPPGSD